MDKPPSSSHSPRRPTGAYTSKIPSPPARQSLGTTTTSQIPPRQSLDMTTSSSSSDTIDVPALPQSPQPPDLPVVGSRVKVMKKQDIRFGMVMFVGKTDFGPNTVWAGLRLDEPYGTHDGCFRKKRYFSCEQNHGLFVHAASCKVLENFDVPAAQSTPVLHSGPSPSTPSTGTGRGPAAPLSSLKRAVSKPPSPRGALKFQVISPLSSKIISHRPTTAIPPVTTTTTASSSSSSSSNHFSPMATSIAMPVVVAPRHNDDMEEMIVEALLHSTAVQEKIAATVSEEVERKVQEKLKQVREDTTALRDQLLRETRSMATVVSGGIQGIEDKIEELKDRMTATAATGSQAQEEMEAQAQALSAIMEMACAAKRHLHEDAAQRVEALEQLRIISEEANL